MMSLVRLRAATLVFECDDALHLGYPGEARRAARRTRRKVQRVLKKVDVVTTSNPLLASELKPSSGRVLWYPGPSPAPEPFGAPAGEGPFWLGSPSTAPHLWELGSLADELSLDGWACVAVGAAEGDAPPGWRVVGWSPAEAERWLRAAAVGVMPQRSTAWDDRKAAYKVLQYAAAGAVPVASDVVPARVLLEQPPLQELLVGAASAWRPVIESAQATPERWRPALAALVEHHSVDRCAATWSHELSLASG